MSIPSLPKRSCPICRSPRSTVLSSQAFDQLSDVHLLDGYDVVLCADCGFGFADKIPPQEIFDTYYRNLSKYEYGHRRGRVSEFDERRFDHTAQLISDAVPDHTVRILEIGCSTGRLLALLKEKGYSSVFGVDPSAECARIARDLYGIQVEPCSIFDIPDPTQRYGLVVLIGVLEHVSDLDLALDVLRRLVAPPKGKVFIAVPDAASFAEQQDGPFQEFSLEHVNFFSSTSLTNLFQTRSFRHVGSGRTLLEHSKATWCSTIHGIFECSDRREPILVDTETEAGLRKYIERSLIMEKAVTDIIDRIVAEDCEIFVWGTGAHTLRLLKVSQLSTARISAFIDSNPKYQGQTLAGIPVWPPTAINGRKNPIMISSYAAQEEIVTQIRDGLRIHNDLILLYNAEDSAPTEQGHARAENV